MRVYIDDKVYDKDIERHVKIKISGTTFIFVESHDHKLMINKTSADDCNSIKIYPHMENWIEID